MTFSEAKEGKTVAQEDSRQ